MNTVTRWVRGSIEGDSRTNRDGSGEVRDRRSEIRMCWNDLGLLGASRIKGKVPPARLDCDHHRKFDRGRLSG